MNEREKKNIHAQETYNVSWALSSLPPLFPSRSSIVVVFVVIVFVAVVVEMGRRYNNVVITPYWILV